MSHHHHHQDQDQGHHGEHGHGGGLQDLLDLDAEVLAAPLRTALEVIESLADAPVRSVLDLGAGTGAGTFWLLQHFAGARAVAVDESEEMLERLRARAEHLGLSDRITAVHANLDEGVPELEPVDLVWASASLHHLADPDTTLTQLVAHVRRGGLLAVLELGGMPRFLPDDTLEGAAEARAHDVLAADRAVDLPSMGGDWGPRLTHAGLVLEVARTLEVDLAPPHAPVVGRYAAAALARIQGAVADRLDVLDRAALDSLLDGGACDVRRRSDLHVRTVRELWVARRT